jgi:hypothetical protein
VAPSVRDSWVVWWYVVVLVVVVVGFALLI